MTDYTNAVNKLSEGASGLAANNSSLLTNSATLSAGASQLASKSPELTANFGKLVDGASQLTNGSGKLVDGSSLLTNKLSSLTSGSESLASGLTEAGDKLSTVTTKEDNAKILADPLSLHKTDRDKVEKNGIGMAPYMISVALFVAAISTNIIFSTLPSGKNQRPNGNGSKHA